MFRLVIAAGALGLFILAPSRPAFAQASKRAEKQVKEAEAAQAKSWGEVDRINNQTDQTKARLNQSRQSAAPQQGGYTVKKKETATVSPYNTKAKSRKSAEPPKQK